MITRQQAEWAKQHDWFHCMHKTERMWYIVTVVDSMHDELVEFDNFDDLQAWAGY